MDPMCDSEEGIWGEHPCPARSIARSPDRGSVSGVAFIVSVLAGIVGQEKRIP